MKGFPLAITLNANLMRNQTEGSLKAIASFVKRGRTVNVVRTAVYGDSGKLIADVGRRILHPERSRPSAGAARETPRGH